MGLESQADSLSSGLSPNKPPQTQNPLRGQTEEMNVGSSSGVRLRRARFCYERKCGVCSLFPHRGIHIQNSKYHCATK